MLYLLSPAKSLDYDTPVPPEVAARATRPVFLDEAAALIDVLKARFADQFHYILYFQEPGVAEQELEADPLFTLRHLLWRASGAESDGVAQWRAHSLHGGGVCGRHMSKSV